MLRQPAALTAGVQEPGAEGSSRARVLLRGIGTSRLNPKALGAMMIAIGGFLLVERLAG
ncbi:hypothetical protein [Streptomyces tibetensis]|uniref:hypothetical protein n=1 Tax=Streptomyces tibetensis TaxID=2382123 RepID=UPI0033C18056